MSTMTRNSQQMSERKGATKPQNPPMKESDEANSHQLDLARKQGNAYVKALKHMANDVADDGKEKHAGPYIVAYAIEAAEGMYHLEEGELTWQDPEDENLHIEISVRDAADNRFVPGLEVHVAVSSEEGDEIGDYELPFLWHPWLYHYGRNVEVPGNGNYRFEVTIEPPTFMRHDEKNGKRYAERVQVVFENVEVETGQE